MLRGWFPFYRSSVALGLRRLLTGHFSREAVIRVIAPIEDSRFFELPATVDALAAKPGERVLDLASPKLAAVALARSGARVTSVDLFESEIATWRDLAGHVEGLDLQVGDGRRLPFADESFDHAYSISVLEHIGDDGDINALAELARVVRPGGRIVFTVPYDRTYREDWKDAPLYRKVTRTAAAIRLGQAKQLRLGNLDATRDWSYAGDVAEAMWLMLQQDTGDDYVVCSGVSRTVRELVETAFAVVDIDVGEYVVVDPEFVRPPDPVPLVGDPSKARELLHWQPRTGFEEMIEAMVVADLGELAAG